jgi:N-methylhydantoinase B
MRSLIDYTKRFSPKHVLIRRANGEVESHAVTSGLTLNTDYVTQVVTGTGAGWGDPMECPSELVKQDLKNGYITLEQANRYYGLDKRSESG